MARGLSWNAWFNIVAHTIQNWVVMKVLLVLQLSLVILTGMNILRVLYQNSVLYRNQYKQKLWNLPYWRRIHDARMYTCLHVHTHICADRHLSAHKCTHKHICMHCQTEDINYPILKACDPLQRYLAVHTHFHTPQMCTQTMECLSIVLYIKFQNNPQGIQEKLAWVWIHWQKQDMNIERLWRFS